MVSEPPPQVLVAHTRLLVIALFAAVLSLVGSGDLLLRVSMMLLASICVCVSYY